MPETDLPNLSTPPGGSERQTAFSSLRHRDFRLLWLGQIVSVTGSQMQMVAINWHIYLITHSALALVWWASFAPDRSSCVRYWRSRRRRDRSPAADDGHAVGDARVQPILALITLGDCSASGRSFC